RRRSHVCARTHPSNSGGAMAGAGGRCGAALGAGYGYSELTGVRAGNPRDYALESFGFGVTRPTRVGLAPGCSFITLVTSCMDSTGEITRVRWRSASRPLRTAKRHEGRMTSMTRIFSIP